VASIGIAITSAVLLALLPPLAFDHAPTQSYRVETAPARIVKAVCHSHQVGKLVIACSFEARGRWVIYLRDDLTPRQYEVVLRHEKAHVNGWEHRQ
jgi:hypothetical protein